MKKVLIGLAIVCGLSVALRAALPATDTFTNSNGTALATHSASWTVVVGAIDIQSNAAHGNTAVNFSAARWTADAFNANQYAQGVVSGAANGYVGPAVRVSADGDGYYALWNPVTNTLDLSRIDNGNTETILNSVAAAAAGSVIRIEANGSTIRVLDDGVQVLSEPDATYSSGAGGMYFYDDEAVFLDTYEAGNLGGGGGGCRPGSMMLLGVGC